MWTHVDVAGHALRALYLDLCAERIVMPEAYTGEPTSPLLPPIVIPKPASLMPIYVAIALGAMVIGGALVVIITLLRPDSDNATLISTALTGVGVATLQALNFIKSAQAVAVGVQTTEQVGVLHKSVNSGFEEFARLIRAEAHAAGVKESEAKQLDLAAVEARIAAAVESAVARTLLSTASAPPSATANVNVSGSPEAVAVEEIRPKAAQAIADAVRVDIGADVTSAVEDALPPKEEA